MKIKLTKRRLLIALTVITACSMILYTACKKQFSPDITSNSFIGKAQKFMSDAVKKERGMLEKPDSILGLYTRRFARIEKLSALLNWNDAKEYSQDGLHFVIALVNESRKPFKNQNFEAGRGLIFYLDNSGRMKMRIMEIISKKEGTLGTDLQQTARIAFINEQRNENNRIEGINATVIFYDENYKQENSFQIANGSWTATKAEFKNTATVKKRPLNARNQRVTCQTCTHWYLVGIWYDTHTYEVVDYEILNEWDECTENSPPPDAGYGSPPAPAPEENCDDVAQQLEGSPVSENQTTDEWSLSPDGLSRTKGFHWVIYRQNWGMWQFISHEIGVQEKQNDSNYPWKWKSLTHQNISKEGSWAGGTVDCSLNTAVPHIWLYYASMDLDYTINGSAMCKGFPLTSHRRCASNAMWGIND